MQRGYVLTGDGARTLKVKFNGSGGDTVFNPVFILKNFPDTDLEITVNGDKPAEFRIGRESDYGGDTLVVWIGRSVPGDAVVRIRAGDNQIIRKLTD